MTTGSALQAPKERAAYLRLSAGELKDCSRSLFHMRESGEGLVVAEGEEELFPLPGSATGIAAAGGRLFAHDDGRRRLYLMKADLTGYEYFYGLTQEPYRVLQIYDTEGNPHFYGATAQSVIAYKDNASSTVTAAGNKGGWAAQFRDRLFTARGVGVYYSKPFDPLDWTEKRYGGGYLELRADGLGEIGGIQPYKDKLYLFREHGVTALRVLGDELNFKAAHLCLKCGTLIKNSVAICGENVGYLTDRGFFLFNGAASALSDRSVWSEIDVTSSVKAVSCCGSYYALVTKKTGENAVYCFDPATGEAHLIENGAADIAADDGLYFTRDKKAYRMTERGLSQGKEAYVTARNVAFGLGAQRSLRAVAIEGEGSFYITVSSKSGARTVRGSAGDILKLRSPLRGNGFDIKIGAEADVCKARLCAVRFRFTEEDDDD